MTKKHLLTSVCASLFLLATPASYAESLHDALVLAYQNNPSLAAARAEQKALDEGVSQARSLFRPTISTELSGSLTESESTTSGVYVSNGTDSYTGGFSVTQRLYNGGASIASVRQARASAHAGQFALHNTTQNTLLQTVEAYMDVLRNNAILHLRQRNIEVLKKELRSTKDRFQVGEVTRTDVAQSEARLASAEAELQAAFATAESSKASYVQVVGKEPYNLETPNGISAILPSSLNDALERSYRSHPSILSAMKSVEAAEENVNVQLATIKPKVNLIGSGSKTFNTDSPTTDSGSLSATIRATIPIYSGGSEYSQIRQAKQTLSQQKLNRDARIAEVRAAVISAWHNLAASREQIKAARSSVKAAEVALNGVIEEVKVGQRTTLDLLNSRQELLDSRVSLVTAERNAVVSAYSLVSSIGEMSPQSLGLQVVEYDPNIHLMNTEGKWLGLRAE